MTGGAGFRESEDKSKDMKISIRRKIQKIIDKKYLTDWEFICNEIAPEIEEEDFNIDEVVEMIQETNSRRTFQLYKDTKGYENNQNK